MEIFSNLSPIYTIESIETVRGKCKFKASCANLLADS